MKIERYNAGKTFEHMRLFARLTDDKKLIKLNEFLNLVHADSSSPNSTTAEGFRHNYGMRIVVCSSQENVLGFLTWGINGNTQQAEIFFFAVNKAFRGKKIGKIIFLTGIQDIVEFGYNRANAESMSCNPSANVFYEKMGARLISKRNFGKELQELFNNSGRVDLELTYRFFDLKSIVESNQEFMSSFVENSHII